MVGFCIKTVRPGKCLEPVGFSPVGEFPPPESRGRRYPGHIKITPPIRIGFVNSLARCLLLNTAFSEFTLTLCDIRS